MDLRGFSLGLASASFITKSSAELHELVVVSRPAGATTSSLTDYLHWERDFDCLRQRQIGT